MKTRRKQTNPRQMASRVNLSISEMPRPGQRIEADLGAGSCLPQGRWTCQARPCDHTDKSMRQCFPLEHPLYSGQQHQAAPRKSDDSLDVARNRISDSVVEGGDVDRAVRVIGQRVNAVYKCLHQRNQRTWAVSSITFEKRAAGSRHLMRSESCLRREAEECAVQVRGCK